MQYDEEPNVDDAIKEIAGLVVSAYRRRSRIRLVHTMTEPPPSVQELANSTGLSVHGLTLTRVSTELGLP